MDGEVCPYSNMVLASPRQLVVSTKAQNSMVRGLLPMGRSVVSVVKSTITRDFAGSPLAGTFEVNEIAMPAQGFGPVSTAASAPPVPVAPPVPPVGCAPELQAAMRSAAPRPSDFSRVVEIMGPLAVTPEPKTGSNARTFARAHRGGQSHHAADPRLTAAEAHAYRAR